MADVTREVLETIVNYECTIPTHRSSDGRTRHSLLETVRNLVQRGMEGTHWDFKCQHHENKADLIHDVLCLANADHVGDRFLIFGIHDGTLAVHSVDNTPNRRRQADIAGLFRDNSSKFFQSRIPAFHLRELNYGGKLLDVLIIEDMPHKPYHLVEDYRDSGRQIQAHHIYTRTSDTNTPLNDAAPPHEIERMWRERFGLDMPPLKRAQRYLDDPDGWLPMTDEALIGEVFHYYGTFPEFTLRVENTDSPVIACNEEWTRGEICTDNNSAWHFTLYYHQTLLHRTRYVSFDDLEKSMVAPTWERRGAGRFYFYREDSVDYAVQRFFTRQRDSDYSKSLRIRGGSDVSKEARALWPDGMAIPVLRTGELEGFLGPRGTRLMVDQSRDETKQYELFLRNQLDFEKWRRMPHQTP